MNVGHITALILISSITLLFVVANMINNYFRNNKIEALFKKMEHIEIDRAHWKARITETEKDITEISRLVLELNNYHLEIDRLKNKVSAVMIKQDEINMQFDFHRQNNKIHKPN